MDRVIVTNPFCGFAHMSVCAANDASDAEILAVCNAKNPAGTLNGWCDVVRFADENGFTTPNMLPVACADHPNERTHYMVAC